jgi:high affinity Mn2+ porin
MLYRSRLVTWRLLCFTVVARLLVAALTCWPLLAAADDAPTATDESATEQWAIHGQSTYVQQFQPAFRSSYQGPQSLPAPANGRETFDVTLYLGLRPWQGAEIWLAPEIDQGFGIGNAFGVAGYPSGEAFKLGHTVPYYRMAEALFRQTIDLGGATEQVDPDLDQLGGTRTANRVVLTVGKIAPVDIFDTNSYAHEPREDFLNWAVSDVGTFDFGADAWGGSYGAAAEWY